MSRLFLAFVTLVFSGAAIADIQLKIKDFRGATSTVSSNGQRARIEDGKTPGYVIVDYANGQILMVDTNRGEVMRTSAGGDGAGTDAISVTLKDKGGGQKIAGYETRKFQMLAGGSNCGTVYASKKLAANAQISAIFEAMRNLQQAGGGMLGSLGALLSECQRASMQLGDVFESTGVPLKVLDENGRILSEVTAVNTEKSLPSDYYQPPAGMRVVDMTEMMNQAAEQTRQIMQQMPDMNELMKQAQENGGEMSEEMQQQLEQMLQQMQQQQQ